MYKYMLYIMYTHILGNKQQPSTARKTGGFLLVCCVCALCVEELRRNKLGNDEKSIERDRIRYIYI